jgi:AbrB family looped-hinge helix DNA binding protein
MQTLGTSRIAARGQITLPSELRTKYGTREGDMVEFVSADIREIRNLPEEKTLILAIPKRAQELSPSISRELEDTILAADEGRALSLSELESEINVES